jgi:hypothetical protein
MPSDPETVRNYIVCYSTPLVAEDISSGISEWDPQATVQVCSSPEELAAMVDRTADIRAVIASQAPSELSTSGLLNTLRDKGGQLIWLASREDIAMAEGHPNVVALDVPFTTETLHDALRSLERS